MKYNIHNLNGKVVSEFNLDDSIFGIVPNHGVVRQAVLAEMTNMRQGTHASKNRALVNGGGKKPFKQKGRGGARAGTFRSPLWKGGGTVFGPEPHPYKHKLQKKVSRLARKSLFSSKVLNHEFFITFCIPADALASFGKYCFDFNSWVFCNVFNYYRI